MKRYFTLLFIFPLSSYLFAQSPFFSWARQFGGTGNESGRSVAVDLDGNVYSTGVFFGTADFDPGAGTYNLSATGAQDVYVTKQDSVGNFTWAKKIGSVVTDNAYTIKVDNSGNVYVVGSFNGTCSFDLINLTSAGMGDAFVCKLDPAGNFLWAKRMGGTGNDAGVSVYVDGSGNVHSTGYFSNTGDFDPDGVATYNLVSAGGLDIYVSKLDAAGNFISALRIGGTGFDAAFDLTLDGSGNMYTTGYFNNTVDFDPGAGTASLNAGSGEDIYVNKLDASGNYVWARSMNGNTFTNAGFSLKVDASGNVYSAGYFSGTVDFDPGAGTSNLVSGGGTDAYVSKLDAAGNFVWISHIGGSGNDGAYSLSLDPGGNVFYAGDFESTVDFDPGGGTFNMTAGIFDVFVSKLNASGNFSSAIQLATNNGAPSIALLNSSHVYITGGFAGTTDFDAGAGTSNLTVVGSNDAFVTRYIIPSCPVPSQPGPITGLIEICAGSSHPYATSFVTGAASYTWTLPAGWTGSSITNSINITASSSSGIISVTANNACGSSTPQTLNVTVSDPVLFLTPVSGTCHDSCNAMINPVTTGGVGGYTYMPFPLTDFCPGTYTVTVTDAAGCTATSTATISNPSPPAVAVNATDTALCLGEFAAISLTGADTFTWNGAPIVSSFNFSPAADSSVVVVGIDSSGCIGSDSIYFTVNPLPLVDFTYPGLDTVCVTYALQSLTGGTPSGGMYSGPGVTGTSFDPNAAGAGTHMIVYDYTDANTCSNSDTVSIVVLGCSGIENENESSVLIYPNPFIHSITLTGIHGTANVILYNVWGEEINRWKINETKTILEPEGLAPGAYYIRIETDDMRVIRKIIKY